MAVSGRPIRTFLLPLVLVLSLRSVSVACRYAHHCDDGNDDTFDLCLSPHRICLHVASRQTTSENAFLRTPFFVMEEANKNPLSIVEKRKIISAAVKVMQGINPHQFMQLNYLGVDIVKELVTFSKSLSGLPGQTNLEFHGKLQSIFQLMDDQHTRYFAPYPLNTTVASTFFRISQFFVTNGKGGGTSQPRYVVSSAQRVGEDGNFGLGSEVLTYDGKPVHKAVLELGRNGYASNRAAQISRGVVLLTARSLAADPFPGFVIEIGFRNKDGSSGTSTVPWNYLELKDPSMRDSVAQPFNSTALLGSQTFATVPGISRAKVRVRGISRLADEKRKEIKVAKQFQSNFGAATVLTKSGTFGLLTLTTFGSEVTPALITELSRILNQMPKQGLVLDLRDNIGGEPDFVRLLAELVSDKTVPFQPSVIRATKLMSDFLKAAQRKGLPKDILRDLPSWRAATRTALQVGEGFTGPTTNIYSDDISKRRKQVYKGPVITLVGGLTYSAGDIFTALQVDEKMSLVIGTSANVGAGGASTISYSSFTKVSKELFPPLPRGADFATAFSRIYRTGSNAGAILENFGVQPNIQYFPTYDDAVDGDCDLFEFLAKQLVKMKA